MRGWAQQLKKGSEVLELGCGHGVISEVLTTAGLTLFAVDASPTLLAAFSKRFPDVRTECSAAEGSNFFGRKFDGVVAWGLVFLLEEKSQKVLLIRAAEALKPGGQLIFTAPYDRVEWKDSITDCPSLGLGASEYEEILKNSGLSLLPGSLDEGDNYYFRALKA
jgi:cyclopropane fatty-acyl-phospholipid synthase-like methyltransferase